MLYLIDETFKFHTLTKEEALRMKMVAEQKVLKKRARAEVKNCSIGSGSKPATKAAIGSAQGS